MAHDSEELGDLTSEYKTPKDTSLSGKIIYQNMRSLRGNFSKLKEYLMQINTPPEIIAMQETWAPHPWQHTLPGYQALEIIERKGISANKGGGVGFFIKNNTAYTLKGGSTTKDIEYIIIECKNINTNIINIYRPPRGDIEVFINVIDNLVKHAQQKYSKIIIGGDLNINLLQTQHDYVDKFNELINKLGLVPKIFSPTRCTDTSKTLIDNIYTNETQTEGEILITEISDHAGIAVALPKGSGKPKPQIDTKPHKHRDTNPENLQRLNIILKGHDWTDLQTSENPCKKFYDIFQPIYEMTCPVITTKKPNKKIHPIEPWMTYGLVVSRRTKAKLKKEAIQTGHWTKYKIYRNIYNRTLKKAKLISMEHKIKRNHGNSREIWKTVNSYIHKTKSDNEGPQKIIKDNKEITHTKEIAQAFNNYFTEVGPKLAKLCSPQSEIVGKLLGERKSTQFNFKQVTKAEVMKVISKMEPKKSTGHDEISNKVLKAISNGILTPLTIIINRCIKDGTFPKEWKLAKVIPIHKKGSKEDMGNYRPISLLPTMSKVIEKILDKQIREYMEENNYFTPNQFGFRKEHETGHILMKAQEKIAQDKRNKETTIGVFLDLKKAFDTVDHQILIKKIGHYGINTNLIKSYLQNRKQYMDIKGCISGQRTITHGVPQGSILGPLFFILFINDLPLASEMCTLLFADDTTLLLSGKDKEELITNTNNNLRRIKTWFDSNGLTVHAGKTNYMVFNTRKRSQFNGNIKYGKDTLERIGEGEANETTKFVGIYIDELLKWKTHINKTKYKITNNLYILSANKHTIPTRIKILLYNSFIKPHMDYGIELWGKQGQAIMSKLQKKAVRIATNTRNPIAHSEPIYRKYKILKFEDVLKQRLGKLCYRYTKNTLPQGLKNLIQKNENRNSSRNPRQLHEPTPKNNWEHNLPQVYAPKIWNNIPAKIKTATSVNAFKYTYKKHLLENYENFKCTVINCPSCVSTKPSFKNKTSQA